MSSDISSHTEQGASPHLSVVSPVYGSPAMVPVLCERLHTALAEITDDYEIVLVFDCSPDDGWERICGEASKDARVKGVRLSRNFGQSSAVRAGLHYARGEWIAIMDCDLQDQPEEIPKMYSRISEGYKVIFGIRAERQDHAMKRLSSYLFNKLLNFFSGSPSADGSQPLPVVLTGPVELAARSKLNGCSWPVPQSYRWRLGLCVSCPCCSAVLQPLPLASQPQAE